jgi:hypothetical protein
MPGGSLLAVIGKTSCAYSAPISDLPHPAHAEPPGEGSRPSRPDSRSSVPPRVRIYRGGSLKRAQDDEPELQPPSEMRLQSEHPE